MKSRMALASVIAAVCMLVGTSASSAKKVTAFAWSGTSDFGAVTVGSSATQVFTLTNTQGSASAALQVSLSGASGFVVTQDGCTGTSIGPSKSCSVSVTFNATGCVPQSATLTATSKFGSATIILNGQTPPSGASSTIYVATIGSDTNPGNAACPLQTIDAAVSTANSTGVLNIDVASGTYNEGAGGLNLTSTNAPNGLQVTGGLSSTDWTASTSPTTIDGATQAVFVSGVTGVGLTNLTLIPTTPSGMGTSVYGLRAIGSTLALNGVSITSPAGHDGVGGSAGLRGLDAPSGSVGSGGFDCTGPIGGSGGGGGGGPLAGGDGGVGGCEVGFVTSPGANGQSGLGPAGGAGGSTTGNPNGTSGGNGSPGSGGAGGSSQALAVWVPGTGSAGTAGTPGSGGGGGAGGHGSCSVVLFCIPFVAGYGGGGGGGGGLPGYGGTGGTGGGGSFAVYLDNSTLALNNSALNAGSGGAGGAGGGGGIGGAGGFGAVANGNGGAGGYGGNAGGGGGGGGGAGGPSVAVYLAGTSMLTPGGVGNVLTPGPAGAPGSGGGGGDGVANQGGLGGFGVSAPVCP